MDDILKQNIINDLGIGALPKEQQEEALFSIGNIIFQKVLIKVIENMAEADKDAFEKLLFEKGNEPEIILNFLRLKVDNLDAIVIEEIGKFKQESVDFMKNIAS